MLEFKSDWVLFVISESGTSACNISLFVSFIVPFDTNVTTWYIDKGDIEIFLSGLKRLFNRVVWKVFLESKNIYIIISVTF